MKNSIISLVISWLLAGSTPVSADAILDGPMKDLKTLFREWQVEFGKEYSTAKELATRMEIWVENHFHIEAHNFQDPRPSYELGHNQFSDMTLDEYQAYNFLGPYSPGIRTPSRTPEQEETQVLSPDQTALLERRLFGDELPTSVDWRSTAVTPVKNQLMCGSCWAYSAIGAIEGARFLDTEELVSLSEQQLVDCDTLDSGCQGGLMDNAFLFDENNTGICSEDDYPYAGHKHWLLGCYEKKGLCNDVSHTRVKSFLDVTGTNTDLMAAISIQPVSVAIQADQTGFQLYKSGVFSADCGVEVDHGVLAVGYGTTDDGVDYWLIKNSWGASWGDSGYIKIARDSTTVEEGMCGILTHASRPILED